MPLIVSIDSSLLLLAEILSGTARGSENWEFRLYNAPKPIQPADTVGHFDCFEASFAGYRRHILIRSISEKTWSYPVAQPPSGDPAWNKNALVAHSQYGDTPRYWKCGSHGDTIHGYYIVGCVSGVLIAAEAFARPRELVEGVSLSITPVFEMA